VTVEFGLKLPDHEDIVRFARRAESLDLDYVFQGEHVFFHGPVSNSLIDLSFAAAVTERLKLLSSVTLIPLYPAALLAKMVASIAVNSKGRFNLGVGVGGEFAAEFAACGVSVKERGRITDASMNVMMKLWRGEPIGPFEGSGDDSGVSLNPLPPGGKIPVWVGGRSSATIERAVRIGDWWMPYFYSLDKFKRDRTQLAERAAQLGRPCPKAALHAFLMLSANKQAAIADASRILSQVYNQKLDHTTIERLCIVGNAADCIEQIQKFLDAGAETLCFNLLTDDPAGYDARMEELSKNVLPPLRTANCSSPAGRRL
jgi:alkanesulfonate monooxygenase SsuD/methylene tetrahydromethanopterin reductase-like flavin-dependent oxidoreductase (luciferase family)